ncbi:MAG: E3 binding domain-containing protein, partial [Actinobacteria bacterium]|nr:E3 binding domain-containing protein [Actinomycetota bacterium]
PTAPRAAPTPRPAAAPAHPSPPTAGKTLATPAARQLAREHGVELERVRGTGSGGVVELKDVVAFLEGR